MSGIAAPDPTATPSRMPPTSILLAARTRPLATRLSIPAEEVMTTSAAAWASSLAMTPPALVMMKETRLAALRRKRRRQILEHMLIDPGRDYLQFACFACIHRKSVCSIALRRNGTSSTIRPSRAATCGA